MEKKAYTVSAINKYVKNMFLNDGFLSHVYVKGEVSNCKYHTSGHLYFTLKDNEGAISCIMYRSSVQNQKLQLENGMKIQVSGRIDVYERDGKYQLYATSFEQEGLGSLYEKYAKLKEQYEEMGLFDPSFKRPIPKMCDKIGIVTASSGAAIHDIMSVSMRRNPYVQLILYPAKVQGQGASLSIAEGIRTLDAMGLDVIIVGRGGGSMEDLWAFNEETVVEAIFKSHTPIISAVGHEKDFTLSDFVADLRAATPSAAAELAVFDISLTLRQIDKYKNELDLRFASQLRNKKAKLDSYLKALKHLDPSLRVTSMRNRLEQKALYLDQTFFRLMDQKKNKLKYYALKLDGASPLKRLKSGFLYAENQDGKHIVSVNDIKVGDQIQGYLIDGLITSRVESITKNKG